MTQRGSTFGDLGAVTVSIDGGLVTAATATLDAATTERTMLLEPCPTARNP